MRISTPNNAPRKDERGFTLVELMVVLVVLAVASAAVIMTMPPRDGGVQAAAVRFAARTAAARDQAVMTGRPTGVWLSPSGYGFEQQRDGRWQPITSGTFREADWGEGIRMKTGDARASRVRFDSVGMPSQEMLVELSSGDQSRQVRIGQSGDIGLVR